MLCMSICLYIYIAALPHPPQLFASSPGRREGTGPGSRATPQRRVSAGPTSISAGST